MNNDWQKELKDNPKYWGKIIAIVDEKIFDSADSYFEMDDKMKGKNLKFSTFHVPKQYDAYRILPFNENLEGFLLNQINEKAKIVTREDFERILSKVPDVEPEEYDRL